MREELSRQLQNTGTLERGRSGAGRLVVLVQSRGGTACSFLGQEWMAMRGYTATATSLPLFPQVFRSIRHLEPLLPKFSLSPRLPRTHETRLWRQNGDRTRGNVERNTGRSDDQQPQISILSPFPLLCPAIDVQPRNRDASSPPLAVKEQKEPGFGAA
ncbi:hypothetical protein BDV11DRAFT_147498 [Aspergillus similis]